MPPSESPHAATVPPVEIVEATVPAVLDTPDAWPLHGVAAVSRACALENHGHANLAIDAAGARATMLTPAYRQVRRLVAVAPGARTADAVVGHAMVLLPQVGNVHTARVIVEVHPEHRRQGIGRALAEAVVDVARASGRRLLLTDVTYSPEPAPGPGTIEPPTGPGSVPLDHDSTRFAIAQGLRLVQVARHSVLDLPVPHETLGGLHDRAVEAAGSDYRVHVWHLDIPPEHLDSVATLKTRISTDMPSGDIVVEEDPWDAARVLATAVDLRERGQGRVLVAAEHVTSRSLVAYSEVVFPVDDPAVVFQCDTLVLREHRGRRLGMLVKTSLMAEVARARPDAERVHTWNAAENAQMLAINDALGFRSTSIEARWSRDL
ncbi:GNAT family N-acetyltransferase [Sanguibacter antarcticus]|uniref:Acetyltransferase (GNAT) family protein n=1 Tax=Sanguibacter antarcticus TaxID=372484 RepID=A0A2A9E029_9MICO|nr:GNAT family N-acetyltransferase [Sanguibacter antarcticus]PFG32298.1 acetyltransferase (GNAT) family protein [Sanguibacter antarcticus]